MTIDVDKVPTYLAGSVELAEMPDVLEPYILFRVNGISVGTAKTNGCHGTYSAKDNSSEHAPFTLYYYDFQPL